MKPSSIHKRAAGLAAAFGLAATLIAAPAKADNIPGNALQQELDIFGITYDKNVCTLPGPLAAHIERVEDGMFSEDSLLTKHARTSARILWDRINLQADEPGDGCVPVYLLDFRPFYASSALKTALENFDVVTISSFSDFRLAVRDQSTRAGKDLPFPDNGKPSPEYGRMINLREP
jgi:hypothetical protein